MRGKRFYKKNKNFASFKLRDFSKRTKCQLLKKYPLCLYRYSIKPVGGPQSLECQNLEFCRKTGQMIKIK
ncbi:hypothetical protein BpHYR1_016989 [Brachionus plicatilis]|uniref:Uncharacterized protein n=1 Tax=Brachionus plicatilis TaxID=10195 RepID=A0A3M7QN00_BRAPC|nr:hypothetical protein BpHYR1_016989 [Brachionus plicatilis]